MTDTSQQSILDELDEWLDANWNPDLTVAEWWRLLGQSGWASPSLPTGAFGKDLSRNESLAVSNRNAERGALGAPGGLGMLLAAPTIATHGTPEQIERFVRPIVTGAQAWCQLFSEPGAGSDLAGLGCRAVKDGDEWVVNGHKVWTTLAHVSSYGILVARTHPELPKHRGLTFFLVDMRTPGVEVRPLRQISGEAEFNEVLFTDARIPDSMRVGEPGEGWRVTIGALMHERSHNADLAKRPRGMGPVAHAVRLCRTWG